jgi:hypothetical protein
MARRDRYGQLPGIVDLEIAAASVRRVAAHSISR